MPRLEFGLPLLFYFQDIFVRGRRPSHFQKKELVGDFKNAGREWELKGQPETVRVHNFEIQEPGKGKVAPYGVYDLGRNMG